MGASDVGRYISYCLTRPRTEAEGGHTDIKIGVIGYGYWGPNLARNLSETEGVRVVSCADLRPDRRALAQRRFPWLIVEDSADAVIDHPDLDAIVIATPVSAHYDLARRALESGKHVLVEKPLSRTSTEGRELIALAEARDLVLMVDHTFIYTGAVRKMKELIDAGELGDLYYFDSVRVNLGVFQHDIDVIWDLAPHDLSILTYLVPEKPKFVSAVGAAHTDSGLTDVAYLTLFFDDTLLAHVHLNWLSPVKVRQILIGGNRRMLVYDDMEPSEKVRVYDRGIQLTTRQGLYDTLVDYRTGDMWAPKIEFGEALAAECSHFVECIRHKRMPLSGGAAGLKVVEILEAASTSLVEEGRRVSV